MNPTERLHSGSVDLEKGRGVGPAAEERNHLPQPLYEAIGKVDHVVSRRVRTRDGDLHRELESIDPALRWRGVRTVRRQRNERAPSSYRST
jgi:hypothetical protein